MIPPTRRRCRTTAPLLLPALVAGVALAGCTRYVEVEPDQAHYRTGSPLTDVSGPLEEVVDAVKRIRVSMEYEVYSFAEADAPLAIQEVDDAMLARAVDTTTVSEDRAATAVPISSTDRGIAFVTANHAVQHPDTLVEHFASADGAAGGQERVQSVAVQRSRTNWIVGLPDLATFDVLARDESADLAVLGVAIPEGEEWDDIATLPAEPGDPDRLSWGSYVYVVGYPSGFPIVTRGIVSDPGQETTGSFLIDGLWNHGVSGGPILAVRGEGEALEWVGVARAATGRTEHRLVPEEGAFEDESLRVLYDGPIYAEEVREIEYGITLSVALTEVAELLDRHRPRLEADGYEIPSLR